MWVAVAQYAHQNSSAREQWLTAVLVANKFRNAGQVCVTANRVYVQRSVHDRFAKLVKSKIGLLKVGHGLADGTTTGSLATQRGVERCQVLVDDAREHGARVVCGGKRVGEGWHYEPTLLVGAGQRAMVHREEMFAPILSMYAFDTEHEVSSGGDLQHPARVALG